MRDSVLVRASLEKYWDLVVTVFFKLSGTAIAAVSAVVLAWAYGDEGVGVFAMLRTLPLILSMLTDLGVSHSYAFLINRKGYNYSSVIKTLVVCASLSGALQVIACLLFGAWASNLFGLGLGSNVLVWCSVLAPVMMLQVHVVNILRAKFYLRSANVFLVFCESIILIGVVATCVYLRGSLDYIAYSLSVSSFIILCVCGFIVWRQVDPAEGKFQWECLLEGVRFGVKSQAGSVMQVMSYRFDQIIVGALLGVSSLGVYVVASKVAELFKVFSVALVFVLEPRISRMEFGLARSYVVKSVKMVYMMSFIVVLVGFLIGPLLIDFAFDSWAKESIVPFYILLSGLFFVGGNGLFAAYNMGTGQPGMNSYAIMAGMISTVVLNYMLVPYYGLNGAALASAVSCIITAFFYFYMFKRRQAL